MIINFPNAQQQARGEPPVFAKIRALLVVRPSYAWIFAGLKSHGRTSPALERLVDQCLANAHKFDGGVR